jgi:hypothetical protein
VRCVQGGLGDRFLIREADELLDKLPRPREEEDGWSL